MLAIVFLLTILYAVANAVGAWAVIRRKGTLAALFMLAASTLVVAAMAMVTELPFTRVLLAAGLVLASLSSLLYAGIVMGRIKWQHHLLRAFLAAGLYLLAHAALT